jgi:nucleoside-diphosphate-sugar epimerase
VTGVTGFIGGKLADRLLANGWRVHALLRSTSDAEGLDAGLAVHRHDGTVGNLISIISEAAPDVVFHLASLYLADHRPEQVDELVGSNILIAAQLAEAMTAAGVKRLLNTGTAWQNFGSAEYNPVNLYAATKQASTDLLRFYYEARGLSIVTLKLFDTYGPGDKRRKLVQLLVDAAMSGERLDMSPGEQIIDLTHVEDVVDAFLVAAERLMDGAPVNDSFFVSGERLSVRALVSRIEAVLGQTVHADFGKRPYRPREVMIQPEIAVASFLPGWQRKRDLRSFVQHLSDTISSEPKNQ